MLLNCYPHMIGYLISRHSSSLMWFKSKHRHPISSTRQVRTFGLEPSRQLGVLVPAPVSGARAGAAVGRGDGKVSFQRETYLRADK